MKKKYLKFYRKCMEKGEIPVGGLCASFKRGTLLELFEPTGEDLYVMWESEETIAYWGSGLHYTASNYEFDYAFTPLRQTIVLFMAALNGELGTFSSRRGRKTHKK